MQRLSRTGKQLHELIEALEVSVERRETFVEACTTLEGLIGFNSAVMMPHDQNGDIFPAAGGLVLNSRLADAHDFALHYARQDRLYTDWMLHPTNANQVAHNLDCWARDGTKLHDTEFYCDFLARVPAYSILGATLQHKGRVIGGFAIHRTRGDRPFTSAHQDILNGLLPTLARTLYLIEGRHQSPDRVIESVDTRILRLGLTPREHDVLHLVRQHLSYRRIATVLGISLARVKQLMASIRAKAAVRNREELMAYLQGLHWHPSEEENLVSAEAEACAPRSV